MILKIVGTHRRLSAVNGVVVLRVATTKCVDCACVAKDLMTTVQYGLLSLVCLFIPARYVWNVEDR